MNKISALLVLLLINGIVVPDGNLDSMEDVITSIGIVKEKTVGGNELFTTLVIGIQARENRYYRLLQEDDIITGGKIYRGVNFINIHGLSIHKNEVLKYRLELKKGERIASRKMELVINYNELINKGKVTDTVKKKGFGLGMFIENRLILYQRRALNIRVTPQEMALEQSKTVLPRDGTDRMTTPDFMTNSISLLNVALMGVKLLVNKIKKDKAARETKKVSIASTNLIRASKVDLSRSCTARKSEAPRRNASSLVSAAVDAVNIKTGISRSSRSSRIDCRISSPLIFGIFTSRSTMSGRFTRTISSAADASVVVMKLPKPSSSR
jgi:hypothetical protein